MEQNLREIARLQIGSNLRPWLTTEQVWEMLAEMDKHPVGKGGALW